MRTTRLFGLDFVVETPVEELAGILERDGQTSTTEWRVVVTPNVDHLVRYRKSPTQRRVAETAHMVLPDGEPIVWASRLLGSRIDRRITGSDLFTAWWRRIVAAQRPVLVIAGNEDLAQQLAKEHGGCRCIVPPMFDEGDSARVAAIVSDVRTEVDAQQVDAVVIGLSTVKSHLIASELASGTSPVAGAPLLLLLGASAEFYVGQQRRAPNWMQRSGTEWLYRLMRDPRRMAKRFLIDDMAFIPMVWREWRGRRSAAQ